MNIRKVLCVLLFVLLGLMPFNLFAQDDSVNLVGFVTAKTPVNVRNRPNGAAVASLSPNMSVSILDQNSDGTWFSVELADGQTGWVSASVIRVMESVIPSDLAAITPDNAGCLEAITTLASTLSNGFAMSPDGRLLASYSWKNPIEIYDIRTKILITTLTHHTDLVSGLAFSPDGSELASSSWDGTVKIWNTETWGERTEFKGHSDGVNGVAYSPDGELLASVGMDEVLNVWNTRTGERVHSIDLHNSRVHNVLFSPDGSLIATAGDYAGGQLSMWDVATGEQVWSKTIGGNIYIAFSPNGETLYVQGGGSGLTVTGYDSHTATTGLIIHSAGGGGSSIAVNRDGTLIAAGQSPSGTFIVAGIDTKTVLFTDSSQKSGPASSVITQFSPDGRLLITSDSDSAIRLWGVHSGDCPASG